MVRERGTQIGEIKRCEKFFSMHKRGRGKGGEREREKSDICDRDTWRDHIKAFKISFSLNNRYFLV